VIPRPSAAESIFSAVKLKLSTRAPGKSLEMQRIQALLLGADLQPQPAQAVLRLKGVKRASK
jgi:hypothetical protein